MEAQKEEILVLQSIFTDLEFQWNEHLRKGLFRLEISVPSNFFVFLSVTGAESILRHSIEYLSPLTLEFDLPQDYPEISAPKFEIKCDWMNTNLLASLNEGLLQIWEQDQGPILFAWTVFLKEIGFTHLDNGSGLEVETQSVLSDILANDQEQKAKKFREGIQTCQICFIDTPGWSFLIISGCQHSFCSDCLTHYCLGKIEDGTMRSISCPFPNCEYSVETNVVKKLVPSELFEKYDAMRLNMFLRTISGTTWCPRVNCQHLAEVHGDQCGQCPACGFVFCLTCNKAFHGSNNACHGDEKEDSLEHKNNEVFSLLRIIQKKGPMEACTHLNRIVDTLFGYLTSSEKFKMIGIYLEGQSEKKKMYDDFFGRPFMTYFALSQSGNRSLAYEACLKAFQEDWDDDDVLRPFHLVSKFANMKPCPFCFIPIEKNGGCHHMHCSVCGSHFCWDCMNLMGQCIC